MCLLVLSSLLVLLLTSPSLAQQDLSSALTPDLLGWWRSLPGFTGGDKFIDSTAARRHGVLSGGTTWKADMVLGTPVLVLSFDGTTDGVVIPGALGAPATLSIVLWASFQADADGGQVFSIENSVVIYINNTGLINALYGDGTTTHTIAATTSIIGTGYHCIVYVVNPSGAAQTLSIDGEQVAADTSALAISYAGATNTYLARNPNDNFDVTGTIAEVRVYSRALSTAEVRSLSAVRTPARPPPSLTFAQILSRFLFFFQ